MWLRRKNLFTAMVFAVLAATLAGCGPQRGGGITTACPGKEGIAQAIAVLNGRWQDITPFYANGTCRWKGYDGDRLKQENFPVKIWAVPPDNFCLYGDILFNARGLAVGMNDRQFWFVAIPKEVRGYFIGSKSVAEGCFNQLQLPMNPQDLVEAFGLVRFEMKSPLRIWQLDNDGRFDVLTLFDEEGVRVKKFHIDTCDYLVRKVEYYNRAGEVTAATELDNYIKAGESFAIPSSVKISRQTDKGEELVELTIKFAEPVQLNESQLRRLFSPPSTKQFEYVYQLNDDCEFAPYRVTGGD